MTSSRPVASHRRRANGRVERSVRCHPRRLESKTLLVEYAGVKACIGQDLANQAWWEILPGMIHRCRAAAIRVPIKDVAALLPNRFEAVASQHLVEFPKRQWPDATHPGYAPTETFSIATTWEVGASLTSR
jgi:hypothetical protein